jgi:hypothetical protein
MGGARAEAFAPAAVVRWPGIRCAPIRLSSTARSAGACGGGVQWCHQRLIAGEQEGEALGIACSPQSPRRRTRLPILPLIVWRCSRKPMTAPCAALGDVHAVDGAGWRA